LINELLILLASNIIISTIYFIYNGVANKNFNTLRLLLCIFIPFFGALLFITADYLIKNKFVIENSLYEIDEDEDEFSEIISDRFNVDYMNTLPIVDVLEIKDIKKKRKYAFKSVKGDFKNIYPFLEKIVRDEDPEVVHYASTAISDFRQKINENYSICRENFMENSEDLKNCESFLKAYLDLIIWEELNNTNTFLKRKELSEVFELYFSLSGKVEKNYYVQKIKNEIIIKDFKQAAKSCDRFAREYPRSYKPYLSKLELCYFSEDREGFLSTLKKIKYKDIVLSKQANDIVCFWNNSLNGSRGAV